jgi:16S rRNA (uracil1498-N3)-methyltransferase
MNSMRRFFIASETIVTNTVMLSEQDSRHLVQVLRLGVNDPVRLFDGRGMEYDGRVAFVSAGRVAVAIGDRRSNAAESPLRLTLLQGFLKETKMDQVVRQATELGVSRLVPVIAKRSVARPDARRLATRVVRWEKIATEALKQSRRGCIPAIDPACDLKAALTLGRTCELRIVFWEESRLPLSETLKTVAFPVRSAALLLGPEGGFEAEEVAAAEAAGFAAACLGPRILRAETASLAACALVQHLFGDLG